MHCYDCALDGRHRDAVAVCVDCGAAVCLDHSHPEERWLTRTAAINQVETVHPPARDIRCGVCAAAHHAAGTANGIHTSRRRRPPGAHR
jgi:hypothetical protein